MIFLGRRRLALCCTLLFCLLLGCVSAESIIATVGTDVTLPCNYDAQSHGRHPVCWGRGAFSLWDCEDEVIRSDRTSVTSRLSKRYLLLGDLDKGDMSLIIRQVEESDSGVYICRVEIRGWFNDHTHEVTLTVVPGPPNPLVIETREVNERTMTVSWSPVFDGGRPITSYKIYLKHKLESWDTAVTTEVSHPELTQVTLVDLRPAKSYNLCVFAFNSEGRSKASNVLTVTTKEAAPEGPPLDMHLEALTSHSINVTWKPPRADLRNGVLQSYSISYREYYPAGRQFKRWQKQSVTATHELESIILSNLKPSTIHRVHIQARTNAGTGPASTDLCSTLDEVQTTSIATTIKSTAPAATSKVLMASTSKIVEEADPGLFSIGIVSTLEKFKAFLGVGNIGRMAAIFFFTIIIILFFIFRTRFLRKDSFQHAEKILTMSKSLSDGEHYKNNRVCRFP